MESRNIVKAVPGCRKLIPALLVSLHAWPAAAQDAALEEIVVTARKRTESLQTVPVSVSAISAEAISRTFADSIKDLEGMAPNVVIDTFNAFPNSASISIRGIAHTEIEKSFDPAIGVTIDGVYLGTNSQAMIDNFDLERVEVLRGPQGTLFGKNTIGGMINVTRKKPGYEPSANISASYSSFDRREAKAAVDVPVVDDRLTLRLATKYAKSDGHLENTTTGEDIAGVDQQTFRVAALFEPTENLAVYANLDHIRDRSELFGLRNVNQPGQLYAIPDLAGLAPGYPGFPADDGPLDEVRTDLGDKENEYDTTSLSVQIDLALAEYTLTSVSAFRQVEEDVWNDFDAEAIAGFNSRRVQDHDQFTQELRMSSDWSDSYEIVAGVYYYWSEYSLDQTVDLMTDFITCQSLPGPFASFGCTQNGGASQEAESYAAFVHASVDLTDRARLSFGGRYTYEEKDFFARPITFPVGALGTASEVESWSEFTPKIGLDYQFNDDVFGYVSFATGFKSGGFNGRAGTVSSIGPYDPETVYSYEAGLKTEFFQRRLRVNMAVFYNDYEDMQVELIRPAMGGTGQETAVENAASAETYGFELEFVALPLEGLELSGTLGLLEAEYQDFVADLGFGGVTDNSDLEIRKAPDLQYSIGFSYTRPAGNAGNLLLDARYRWSDEMETTTQNFTFGRRESVGNLDAAIGFESPTGNWKLSLFGRNLTDELFINDALAAGPLLSFASANLPRTVGVQVDFDF